MKGKKSSADVQRHVFAVHGTLVDVQDGAAPAPHYPAALGLSAKSLFDAIECTAYDVAQCVNPKSVTFLGSRRKCG